MDPITLVLVPFGVGIAVRFVWNRLSALMQASKAAKARTELAERKATGQLRQSLQLYNSRRALLDEQLFLIGKILNRYAGTLVQLCAGGQVAAVTEWCWNVAETALAARDLILKDFVGPEQTVESLKDLNDKLAAYIAQLNRNRKEFKLEFLNGIANQVLQTNQMVQQIAHQVAEIRTTSERGLQALQMTAMGHAPRQTLAHDPARQLAADNGLMLQVATMSYTTDSVERARAVQALLVASRRPAAARQLLAAGGVWALAQVLFESQGRAHANAASTMLNVLHCGGDDVTARREAVALVGHALASKQPAQLLTNLSAACDESMCLNSMCLFQIALRFAPAEQRSDLCREYRDLLAGCAQLIQRVGARKCLVALGELTAVMLRTDVSGEWTERLAHMLTKHQSMVSCIVAALSTIDAPFEELEAAMVLAAAAIGSNAACSQDLETSFQMRQTQEHVLAQMGRTGLPGSCMTAALALHRALVAATDFETPSPDAIRASLTNVARLFVPEGKLSPSSQLHCQAVTFLAHYAFGCGLLTWDCTPKAAAVQHMIDCLVDKPTPGFTAFCAAVIASLAGQGSCGAETLQGCLMRLLWSLSRTTAGISILSSSQDLADALRAAVARCAQRQAQEDALRMLLCAVEVLEVFTYSTPNCDYLARGGAPRLLVPLLSPGGGGSSGKAVARAAARALKSLAGTRLLYGTPGDLGAVTPVQSGKPPLWKMHVEVERALLDVPLLGGLQVAVLAVSVRLLRDAAASPQLRGRMALHPVLLLRCMLAAIKENDTRGLDTCLEGLKLAAACNEWTAELEAKELTPLLECLEGAPGTQAAAMQVFCSAARFSDAALRLVITSPCFFEALCEGTKQGAEAAAQLCRETLARIGDCLLQRFLDGLTCAMRTTLQSFMECTAKSGEEAARILCLLDVLLAATNSEAARNCLLLSAQTDLPAIACATLVSLVAGSDESTARSALQRLLQLVQNRPDVLDGADGAAETLLLTVVERYNLARAAGQVLLATAPATLVQLLPQDAVRLLLTLVAKVAGERLAAAMRLLLHLGPPLEEVPQQLLEQASAQLYNLINHQKGSPAMLQLAERLHDRLEAPPCQSRAAHAKPPGSQPPAPTTPPPLEPVRLHGSPSPPPMQPPLAATPRDDKGGHQTTGARSRSASPLPEAVLRAAAGPATPVLFAAAPNDPQTPYEARSGVNPRQRRHTAPAAAVPLTRPRSSSAQRDSQEHPQPASRLNYAAVTPPQAAAAAMPLAQAAGSGRGASLNPGPWHPGATAPAPPFQPQLQQAVRLGGGQRKAGAAPAGARSRAGGSQRTPSQRWAQTPPPDVGASRAAAPAALHSTPVSQQSPLPPPSAASAARGQAAFRQQAHAAAQQAQQAHSGSQQAQLAQSSAAQQQAFSITQNVQLPGAAGADKPSSTADKLKGAAAGLVAAAAGGGASFLPDLLKKDEPQPAPQPPPVVQPEPGGQQGPGGLGDEPQQDIDITVIQDNDLNAFSPGPGGGWEHQMSDGGQEIFVPDDDDQEVSDPEDECDAAAEWEYEPWAPGEPHADGDSLRGAVGGEPLTAGDAGWGSADETTPEIDFGGGYGGSIADAGTSGQLLPADPSTGDEGGCEWADVGGDGDSSRLWPDAETGGGGGGTAHEGPATSDGCSSRAWDGGGLATVEAAPGEDALLPPCHGGDALNGLAAFEHLPAVEQWDAAVAGGDQPSGWTAADQVSGDLEAGAAGGVQLPQIDLDVGETSCRQLHFGDPADLDEDFGDCDPDYDGYAHLDDGDDFDCDLFD